MDSEQPFVEKVTKRLKDKFGQDNSNVILERYLDAFPKEYLESSTDENIFLDICMIQTLSATNSVASDIRKIQKNNTEIFHLRLFQYGYVTALADVLPILENMNFRAISEQSYEIVLESGITIWLSDYTVECPVEFTKNFEELQLIGRSGFVSILNGCYENDGFNKLIFPLGCTCQAVNIFRAYAKYMKQIRLRFSQQYIENTLYKNANIAGLLLEYFMEKYKPKNREIFEANKDLLDTKIKFELDKVKNIDEDIILRQFWQLIHATRRTNYFQTNEQGQPKPYLTFKFKSNDVPDLPLPRPLFEIFVYSKQFEGIHLRADKVARGGIRWSDRKEDYRTEVLALMKAQKVKNSIIVPSGAKGGFVLKQVSECATREEIQAEVIACYRQFIAGILELTDNIVKEKIVKPQNVTCYDKDDTYLVVAADKGTATFSDIANAISKESHYWLGDAFASGGSTGYDHKKLGITAKGSWESIKRHFRDLGMQLASHHPTVVGIGDMSGDVFGNAMIYTKRIRLVAAFDHRHIFIDPSPDPESSFQERLRLFQLPHSSWENYNSSLISKGGGVYDRNLKSILLSEEVKTLLNLTQGELSPSELIKAILRAKVDLLYNGGIGTYVKASSESHNDVADRANEFCRVNADELHCKVVGEGGNLGFTQLARIEYSFKGGLINADFIDNSAGVNCSDHEVNLKIAIDKKVASKQISYEQRNSILNELSDAVAKLVLKENYYQAHIMSFSSSHATAYSDLYQTHIKKLESYIGLSRMVEFIPDEKKIAERKALGYGLTRPELAVLLAYTKIHTKSEILKSTLPEEPYFNKMLKSAFPTSVHDLLSNEILTHYLRREIVATQLSNEMINQMGITFSLRMQSEAGASVPDVVKAFMISSHIYDLDEVQTQIEALDDVISSELQYELLHSIRQLVNLSSRWFLRNCRINSDLKEIVDHYQNSIRTLSLVIPTLIVGQTKHRHVSLAEKFVSAGLSDVVANKLSISRVLYAALNITEVAATHSFELIKTAKMFFAVGGKFNLVWFRDLLSNDNREGSQNSMARLTLRDELDALQRRLTILIMQFPFKHEDVHQLIQGWIDSHRKTFDRWEEILVSAQEGNGSDYTTLFIALHELSNMIDSECAIEKVHQLALHDPLTNLPNRNYLYSSFHNYLDFASQKNANFAVVFIDIDNFKEINDHYGHDVGDNVLNIVTKKLQSCIRADDLLVRHGGDEFILIMPVRINKKEISSILDRISQHFNQLVVVAGVEIKVTLSLGVALYPVDGTSAFQLIKRADEAMYQSKLNGKNQYTFAGE